MQPKQNNKKGCKMTYGIKTNDKYNRFYAKCGNLTFIEEQNKYFYDKVFKTKKLWKAKIMCWLINLACRMSGFKERCVVVKLAEQKD